MQAPSLFLDSGVAAFDVIVIAASLGGPSTLRQIFSGLPEDFPTPIMVAQHLSGRFPVSLSSVLAGTRLPVSWARDGAPLRRGITMAPPGWHLRVTPERTCQLSDGPLVSYARPAADVLFASAAASFGSRALGVVLSGRLFDGTAGAEEVRQAGGVVLAQDPCTCRAPGMVQSALRRGVVDLTLPPEKIACALVSLVMVPGARALFGMHRLPAAGSFTRSA